MIDGDNDLPADWQLPTGVSRALWEYFHDLAIVRNYDAALHDTPLLTLDQQFVLEHCRPPGKILDLGSGTGRLAITLGQSGYRPIAVDLSAEMLKVLREKAVVLGLDIPCVCANLVELGIFADQAVDQAACLFSTLGLVVGVRRVGVLSLMCSVCCVPAASSFCTFTTVGSTSGPGMADDCWAGKCLPPGFAAAQAAITNSPHQGAGRLTMHLFMRPRNRRLIAFCRLRNHRGAAVEPAPDGRLACPWWFGRLRSYGYLIAARRPAS